MGLGDFLIRNVTYPLWMMRDGNGQILRYLRAFEHLNTCSREDMLASQERRTVALLEHARAQCPYYASILPDDLISADGRLNRDVFQQLPVMNKDIVRERRQDMIARDHTPQMLMTDRTGGSTGVPMEFQRDQRCFNMRKGQELFFDRWMGYDIGHKAAEFVAASHFSTVVSRWKYALRNTTTNRMIVFDPHHINDETCRRFLDEFNRFGPSIIRCFPNSLFLFADYLLRNDLNPRPVRSISCTGENLYDSQRELFTNLFGGEVFEKVGTRESGIVACECSAHDGLHVFTEGVLLEIVDDAAQPCGPDQVGRVLLTDLFNYGMPMIRYEIGDCSKWAPDEPCSCGCRLPKVRSWLGRYRDIVLDVQGDPKPGYLFTEVILKQNVSTQFQVVQNEDHSVDVFIVDRDQDAGAWRGVVEKFQEILGEGLPVTLKFTDSIAREPSGKYGYVKSVAQKKYGR